MHTVSITSQGQISIPASLIRKFNLKKPGKATVYATNDGILVRPVKDIFDLAGTFKTNKKYSPKAIDKGFAEYMAKQGVSGL